jgi:hypothetical protein
MEADRLCESILSFLDSAPSLLAGILRWKPRQPLENQALPITERGRKARASAMGIGGDNPAINFASSWKTKLGRSNRLSVAQKFGRQSNLNRARGKPSRGNLPLVRNSPWDAGESRNDWGAGIRPRTRALCEAARTFRGIPAFRVGRMSSRETSDFSFSAVEIAGQRLPGKGLLVAGDLLGSSLSDDPAPFFATFRT